MVKMEVSASAELEYSTSSVDGCESSRSSRLSCHKTGTSIESEIRLSLLDTLRSTLTHRQLGRSDPRLAPALGNTTPKLLHHSLNRACKFPC